VINAVYTPSEAEMAEARRLVAQLEAAAETATGAFVLADGRFVDRAVVESARHTLALGSYAIGDGDSGRPPRAHGDMGEDVL
jgi:citrate lyase subunit beta/citryl-CoA lyase